MNRCLHCALYETLMEWGAEYGDGRDGTERYTTLDQGRSAIATLLGDIIAATLPADDSDSAGCRLAHIGMADQEVANAIALCDAAAAAGPQNDNAPHSTH